MVWSRARLRVPVRSADTPRARLNARTLSTVDVGAAPYVEVSPGRPRPGGRGPRSGRRARRGPEVRGGVAHRALNISHLLRERLRSPRRLMVGEEMLRTRRASGDRVGIGRAIRLLRVGVAGR